MGVLQLGWFSALYLGRPSLRKLDKEAAYSLWLNGFEPREEMGLPLSRLFFQRKIPSLDGLFGRVDTNVHHWNVPNGPIVPLLKLYIEKGEEEVRKQFREALYFKMFDSFNGVESNWDVLRPGCFYRFDFTPEWIWRRVLRLTRLWQKMQEIPYLSGPFERSYIVVLDRPYRAVKYGERWDIDGYEIWSGHHRASILWTLGQTEARVVVATPAER
jgi:hypothetical protein